MFFFVKVKLANVKFLLSCQLVHYLIHMDRVDPKLYFKLLTIHRVLYLL